MQKRILITDKVHPHLLQGLKERGYQMVYDTHITLQQVGIVIHDYHGIIINSKIKMDASLIDRGRNLEFIARLGSGMEIVDIPHAKSKGIRVINTPEGNCNSVGEHAIGMLLILANNLNQGNEEVKNFEWNREKNRGWELKGKTLGIIGVGHTGSSLATKLSSWEMNILGYDKYKKGYGVHMPFIKETSLEELLEKSDIVSFHLPLSEETIGMCNSEFIQKCKDGVVLINTSRGKVIPTGDLIAGLESGKVGGACLDVFENEKVKSYSEEEKELYNQLFQYDNVIVSPHVAGWTKESLIKIAELVLERIENRHII